MYNQETTTQNPFLYMQAESTHHPVLHSATVHILTLRTQESAETTAYSKNHSPHDELLIVERSGLQEY